MVQDPGDGTVCETSQDVDGPTFRQPPVGPDGLRAAPLEGPDDGEVLDVVQDLEGRHPEIGVGDDDAGHDQHAKCGEILKLAK